MEKPHQPRRRKRVARKAKLHQNAEPWSVRVRKIPFSRSNKLFFASFTSWLLDSSDVTEENSGSDIL